MVSPELLRRYPFFGCLDETQTKALAMIAEEVACARGVQIFAEGEPARYLDLLMEGSVDLFFIASRDPRDQLLVGEINPGEPFSISAMIEPYLLTSSAVAATHCRLLRLDAPALRALCEVDCRLGYTLMRQLATVAIRRLDTTRIQLAAARKEERVPA
ncbi:MAG: Crp/Fnr family transcriptional regulator [Chloroflexi bacterium]|nr:Crp/Fnr family transcriptional regulator [Chloroflexota bacterium]